MKQIYPRPEVAWDSMSEGITYLPPNCKDNVKARLLRRVNKNKALLIAGILTGSPDI